MTEQSRRLFLRAAAAGAVTGGAILLPGGLAEAAGARDRRRGPHHDHHDQHGHQDHHDGHGHHHGRPGGSRPPGTPPPGSGSTTYSVTIINNSTQFADFVIYQTLGGGGSNVFPLAWYAAPAWPGTSLFHSWTPDLQFVWSQTGVLAPGVVFQTQQSVPADPSEASQQEVRFSYQQGAYLFQPVQGGSVPSGSVAILQDGSIPEGQAAVGLAMAGAAAYATQAQPNLTTLFTPHPAYWVAAGTYTPGQVLDVEGIADAAELDFGAGTALTATLNSADLWTITAS